MEYDGAPVISSRANAAMAARRACRALWAVAAVFLAAAVGPAAGAAARLRVEPREAVVDEPIWICAERGARPQFLRLDGHEAPAESWSDPDADGTPGVVHTMIPWPALGPLELLRGLERPPRPGATPLRAGTGFLRPGTYVLAAEGFAPETLRVRTPTPAERRELALVARARRSFESGDSAHAARLLSDFLALAPASLAADAARLALLDVLPYTEYAGRPKLWFSEWVARHHQHCVVGAGLERWLRLVSPEAGRRALQEVVASYGSTLAAEEAAARLRAGSATEN